MRLWAGQSVILLLVEARDFFLSPNVWSNPSAQPPFYFMGLGCKMAGV